MNNHIKFFVESVSKLGIAKPELEALEKMCIACLESALYDNYDEDNPEFDSDFNIIDGTEDNDSIEETLPDEDNDFDSLTNQEERDKHEILRYGQEYVEPPEDKEIESTVGTNLANVYTQVAPKLLDMGKCTPSDMDSLANFIDWVIKKFKAFNPKECMAEFETQYNSKKSYDEARMDKILNVISIGPSVVQLLEEIKNKFSSELEVASLTNEPAMFSVANNINTFVADMFNNFDENTDFNAEQEDTSIEITNRGFSNNEEPDDVPTDELEPVDDEPSNMDDGKTNQNEASSDAFPDDTDLETVEKAVNDFITFIPTSELSDSDAAEVNNNVDETKKDNAREIAKQRKKFKSEHKGDVRETGDMPDNPWGDMF